MNIHDAHNLCLSRVSGGGETEKSFRLLLLDLTGGFVARNSRLPLTSGTPDQIRIIHANPHSLEMIRVMPPRPRRPQIKTALMGNVRHYRRSTPL